MDERVNNDSADERADDNYQHFQAECTHTGSPLKKGAIGQKRRFHENPPVAQPGGGALAFQGANLSRAHPRPRIWTVGRCWFVSDAALTARLAFLSQVAFS
jgi:hypothetical protein